VARYGTISVDPMSLPGVSSLGPEPERADSAGPP
jgi:hypothetical protein